MSKFVIERGLGQIVDIWRRVMRHGHATAPLSVNAVAMSHVGKIRQQNEDYFLIVDLTGSTWTRPAGVEHRIPTMGALLVVADGMGGAEAGEVASAMAANTIVARLVEWWRDQERRTSAHLRECLLGAMESANREIHAYANARAGLKGMGTTATAAALLGDHLYVGHVGDSRAYVVREGRAQRITQDHSLVQHLLDTGELTPEAAASSPHRNVLLRALGPQPEIIADVSQHCMRSGDVLVLCSDGLWSCVAEGELVDIVTTQTKLAAACEQLVALANERGGSDNITVVVARFERARRDEATVRAEDVTAITTS